MRKAGRSDEEIESILRAQKGSKVDQIRQREPGITDEQIREKLKAGGMKAEDIDAAFEKAKGKAGSNGDVSGKIDEEVKKQSDEDEKLRRTGTFKDHAQAEGRKRRAQDEEESDGSTAIRTEEGEDGETVNTNRRKGKKKGRGRLNPKDVDPGREATAGEKFIGEVADKTMHDLMRQLIDVTKGKGATGDNKGQKPTAQNNRDKSHHEKDSRLSSVDMNANYPNSVYPGQLPA